jgi:glycosyltransferase involved in cell wall biosynthesis
VININFSVVVPVYNKSACVERMLGSIFSQKHMPAEIIIVDDGSTDDSIQRVRDYKHASQGIIKIINQPNLGVSVARNRGISESSHSHVALLDADDEWLPRHLEDIYTLIKKYPNCIAYSCSHILRDKVNDLEISKGIVGSKSSMLIENFFEVASKYNILNSSTVVLNTNRLKKGKIFPEGAKVGEDLFAWFSIMGNGSIGLCNTCGVIIHQEKDVQRDKRQTLPSYLIEYIYLNKKKLNQFEYKYLWRVWVAHYYGSIINEQRKLSIKYLKYGIGIFGFKALFHIPVLIIPSRVLIFCRNLYRQLRT